MLFNSSIFFIFAFIFFLIWPFVAKRNASKWGFIIVASFIFYGWWDWRYCFLLLGTSSIDFFAALAMQRWPQQKKIFLISSLTANIGSLAFFKYLDFSIKNVNWLFSLFGINEQLPLSHIVLPIGISFYTFQSMSYSIDVYKKTLTPTKNILHFFAYVSLFPQLVAGPIVRAADLLPQLKRKVILSETARWDGAELIVKGFFKKVVVADSFAPFVNTAFSSTQPVSSCSYWWLIMILFALQIYCDFSGYTDIARGLAKWMGLEFPINFNYPYLSSSIREFWTRWHISLSTWFRDYIYLPLGGSRCGVFNSYKNLWIVMLISGIWHGASWTFIVWGAYQAFCVTIERVFNVTKRLKTIWGGKQFSILLTLMLILIGWVFFRAQSMSQVCFILSQLFSFHQFNFSSALEILHGKIPILLGLMILRHIWVYLKLDCTNIFKNIPIIHYSIKPILFSILIAACIFLRGSGSTFIYFQF